MPLTYTPRKFIPHPTNRFLYMIEADHRVLGEEAANNKLTELVSRLNNDQPGLFLIYLISAAKVSRLIRIFWTYLRTNSVDPRPPQELGDPVFEL